MAIPLIKNTDPQSIKYRHRLWSTVLGQVIRFTAGRFTGKRYMADPRRLGYNVGSEHHPNVELQMPQTGETMKAGQFFKAHNLSGSKKCVVGVCQKDNDGNVTQPMRWVSVGRFRDFYWTYIKSLLTGRKLDNVIRVERQGADELQLTHAHRTGVVALEGLQIPHMELMDRVELREGGRTLRVYYRDLGWHDVDISRYGLHRIVSRGRFDIYENPGDQSDPYTLKLFTKRYRVTRRVAGPVELRDENENKGIAEDQEVKYGGLIANGALETQFYLKVTLTTKSKIRVPNLNGLPPDFQATVIRVRSALKLKHLNDKNGRAVGDVDWVPFNQDIQHFPSYVVYREEIERLFGADNSWRDVFTDPDNEILTFKRDAGDLIKNIADRSRRRKMLKVLKRVQGWSTHLVPAGDPRSDYGSGVKDGHLGTCVTSQHFAPNRPDAENQRWPLNDQRGFFGEAMRSFLAWQYGGIEGKEPPWFMPQGDHSLQVSKFLSWAAIFTGSNGMDRAVWMDRLFQMEDIEFDAPYWSQLLHLITITEDAQGAHEKALLYDEHTMYEAEVKSLASTIPHIKQGALQRRRWGAMIGYFLSFSFKYLKDEVIRCRLYGALAKLPLVGRIFERKRIPHIYTPAQVHEWINTGSWYLDSLTKYVFALTPALYVFFGLTPLIGIAAFIAIWAFKTIFGWPAYSYQTTKVAVSPRRTIFPFPRDIFNWYFYIPPVARGVLHIEDEGVGPFASTAVSRGNNIESSTKKQIGWVFTGVPLATAAIGTYKLWMVALAGKALGFAALANIFWPLGLAVGGGILFYNLLNKAWPGERAKFYQSALKFIPPWAGITYFTIYHFLPALSAAAFPGSFLLGLFMNSIWPAYMAAGMIWGWINYVREQQRFGRNNNREDVDGWKNVLREVSFFDVLKRDKLRTIFPEGIRGWLRDIGTDFVSGWRRA
jgi:hypothetical protein